MFHHRAGHYLLLLSIGAVLTLPNLGRPSLWDIDEGNNAEAAREMLESGNWVVPTFNFQLRVDKPALLYWLQSGAYQVFGVNEFAARLPSALAAWLAVLGTYELGRRLYGATAGLLAGLVLAGTVAFCAAAHFANPDALLNACTVWSLLLWWQALAGGGRGWFVLAGACQGLAVLAKGPVGLVLPLAVVGSFLLLTRRLGRLYDRGLLWGFLAFVLVAVPWYAYVGAETKAQFLSGFLLKHNRDRFLGAMEGHGGSPFYYVAALLVGFAPWSVLLGPAVWYAFKDMRSSADDGRRPAVFLSCWVAVYLLFFSLSATKLPNYILPLYPAVALLTARFVDRWRRGAVQPPAWVLHAALTCLGLIGVGVTLGLLVTGGAVELSWVRGRRWPGLEAWAALGLVPVVGACAGWWCLQQGRRNGVVGVLIATAAVFVGVLAAGGAAALERYKAPRALAQAYQAAQTEPEIRVASFGYFQPSLVFYCQREVQRLESEEQAVEFLRCPLPVYVFLPESAWRQLEGKVRGPCRLLGRRQDLYRNCDVVVVTNR